MKDNLEKTLNYFCTNELNSFKESDYGFKLNELATKLGFQLNCGFGFAEKDKKNIYLYYDIKDSHGNFAVLLDQYDYDEEYSPGYSLSIIQFDRKKRIKFHSWENDDDFINSIKYDLSNLRKKIDIKS